MHVNRWSVVLAVSLSLLTSPALAQPSAPSPEEALKLMQNLPPDLRAIMEKGDAASPQEQAKLEAYLAKQLMGGAAMPGAAAAPYLPQASKVDAAKMKAFTDAEYGRVAAWTLTGVSKKLSEAQRADLEKAVTKAKDARALGVQAALLIQVRRGFVAGLYLAARAAQLAPKDPDVANTLGVALRRTRYLQVPVRVLLRAAAQAPKDVGVMTNVGFAVLAVGDLRTARGWFDRALKAAPEDADAELGLGLLDLVEGKPSEGRARLRSSFRHRPSRAAAAVLGATAASAAGGGGQRAGGGGGGGGGGRPSGPGPDLVEPDVMQDVNSAVERLVLGDAVPKGGGKAWPFVPYDPPLPGKFLEMAALGPALAKNLADAQQQVFAARAELDRQQKDWDAHFGANVTFSGSGFSIPYSFELQRNALAAVENELNPAVARAADELIDGQTPWLTATRAALQRVTDDHAQALKPCMRLSGDEAKECQRRVDCEFGPKYQTAGTQRHDAARALWKANRVIVEKGQAHVQRVKPLLERLPVAELNRLENLKLLVPLHEYQLYARTFAASWANALPPFQGPKCLPPPPPPPGPPLQPLALYPGSTSLEPCNPSKVGVGAGAVSMELGCESVKVEFAAGVAVSVEHSWANEVPETTLFVGAGVTDSAGGTSVSAKGGVQLTVNDNLQATDVAVVLGAEGAVGPLKASVGQEVHWAVSSTVTASNPTGIAEPTFVTKLDTGIGLE